MHGLKSSMVVLADSILRHKANLCIMIIRKDAFRTFFITCNVKSLTISDMIKSKRAKATYKAITGLAPSYLSNLFTKNSAEILILACKI